MPMGRTPPDPFREADLKLIRELQTDLKIAKAEAWVFERMSFILAEDYSIKAWEDAKKRATNEFRATQGLGEL